MFLYVQYVLPILDCCCGRFVTCCAGLVGVGLGLLFRSLACVCVCVWYVDILYSPARLASCSSVGLYCISFYLIFISLCLKVFFELTLNLVG